MTSSFEAPEPGTPLPIAGDDIDRLAETLASRAAMGKAAAVRTAPVNERAPHDESLAEFLDKINPVQGASARYPNTGPRVEEAFYDSLYED